VTNALTLAWFRKKLVPGLTHHSDRVTNRVKPKLRRQGRNVAVVDAGIRQLRQVRPFRSSLLGQRRQFSLCVFNRAHRYFSPFDQRVSPK
jgi:hypothetical protein